MRTFEITSTDALRQRAAQWDDLWLHSDDTDPTGRAALLALWLDAFAAGAFRILVVEHDNTFLAAITLLDRRLRGVLPIGHGLSNAWGQAGGLLARQSAETPNAIAALVSSLKSLPWNLLWFECVRYDACSFRLLQEEFEKQHIACSRSPQYEVARLVIADEPWEAYFARLGSAHRKSILKRKRQFEALDGATFSRSDSGTADEQAALVAEIFTVEDLGWKGAGGTSVIKRGRLKFYQQQAHLLSLLGHLCVYRLQAQGSLIAFQYAYLAKEVLHCCKTGYNPRFGRFGPGQLLQYYLLKGSFESGRCQAVDWLGQITDAMAAWQPSTYPLGQLIVAPRSAVGRSLVQVRRHFWPLIQRLRGRGQHLANPATSIPCP